MAKRKSLDVGIASSHEDEEYGPPRLPLKKRRLLNNIEYDDLHNEKNCGNRRDSRNQMEQAVTNSKNTPLFPSPLSNKERVSLHKTQQQLPTSSTPLMQQVTAACWMACANARYHDPRHYCYHQYHSRRHLHDRSCEHLLRQHHSYHWPVFRYRPTVDQMRSPTTEGLSYWYQGEEGDCNFAIDNKANRIVAPSPLSTILSSGCVHSGIGNTSVHLLKNTNKGKIKGAVNNDGNPPPTSSIFYPVSAAVPTTTTAVGSKQRNAMALGTTAEDLEVQGLTSPTPNGRYEQQKEEEVQGRPLQKRSNYTPTAPSPIKALYYTK